MADVRLIRRSLQYAPLRNRSKQLPDLELQHVRAGCLIEQEATEITESLCISLFSLFEGIYMHPLFLKASGLTHDVIGSAIEVHKDKGRGCWSRFMNGV